MLFIRYVHVQPYERVVVFRDGEPIKVLMPGRRFLVCWASELRLQTFDVRSPYLEVSDEGLRIEDLEALVKSGLLAQEVQSIRLHKHERALMWVDGRLDRVLGAGPHVAWNSFFLVRFQAYSVLDVYLQHPQLEVVADSGLLAEQIETVEVGDRQRALVWVDDRFDRILTPGLHLLWRAMKRVRVEVVDVGNGVFEHEQLETIVQSLAAVEPLDTICVPADHELLVFRDGRFDRALAPGVYALWKDVAYFKWQMVDLREQMLDINSQDVMTSDKVTLRINAVVTYRVADARAMVQASENTSQSLYREAQLALRSVIGARELDVLLAEKDAVTEELDQAVRAKATELGLTLVSLGLRDVILPGEMRVLMNRVTEAKKAAEANLIARREETQAMRSQANTARIFESNPTLLKLRELEVLEKVAEKADLKVVLTESGLTDRLVQMV